MRFPTNTQWDSFITAHPDPKPAPRETCPTCRGKKYVARLKPGMQGYRYVVCPDCGGEGEREVES